MISNKILGNSLKQVLPCGTTALWVKQFLFVDTLVLPSLLFQYSITIAVIHTIHFNLHFSVTRQRTSVDFDVAIYPMKDQLYGAGLFSGMTFLLLIVYCLA